jgi:anti-sigma regulatory factor (Ser/Thr protein kinase)
MTKRSEQIQQSLLRHIFWRSRSPVKSVANEFGVTSQAVNLHIKELARRGVVEVTGNTRRARYRLTVLEQKERDFALDGTVAEDRVWEAFVKPLLLNDSAEERGICHYGLTEIFNNAIDHSSGQTASVRVARTTVSTILQVADNGEGIFHKIANALQLTDPRQSLLELSKGKFTTDPQRHTGEGIFFCSRLFDRFQIRSQELLFHHSTKTDDWLLDAGGKEFHGTRVTMELLRPSTTKMEEVFARFSSGPDDYRFAKTHVPLRLATFGDEPLLSRSSAKRVLARVDRFDEVLLDFSGVRSVGQAFSDEIFRVFANAHPKVELIAINANEQVTQMIRRAQAARRETGQLDLFPPP